MRSKSILLISLLLFFTFCKAENKNESHLNTDDALLEEYLDDYHPDFYNANGVVDWGKAKEFLNADSGLRQDSFAYAPQSSGSQENYAVKDLLFHDFLFGDGPFPEDYLPKITDGFDSLVTKMNKKSDREITGDLLIEIRDKAVVGLTELQSEGDPAVSFKEFWENSLREGEGKRYHFKVSIKKITENIADYIAWLEDYQEWIHINSFVDTHKFLLDNGKITEQEHYDIDELIEDIRIDRTTKSYEFEMLALDGNDEFLAIRASTTKLLETQDYEVFRENHNSLVSRIFSEIKYKGTAVERATSLVKALNLYNYFHLQPNGMGRLFMIVQNVESLRLKLPLNIYSYKPRVFFTNSLVKSRKVVSWNRKNMALWKKLVSIFPDCG